MSWFSDFLTSSIGRKVVMSLTGLFLILFLLVHLAGNLQLLPFLAHDPAGDPGKAFNLYSKFMTSNPLIKTVSYLLYASILIHAIQGWLLWSKNRKARGNQGYAVKVNKVVGTNSFAASNMGWLGTIIFIFLAIHMYQFWLQMKLGHLPMAYYDGVEVKNLYSIVAEAYESLGYVIFYVVSMVVIAYHLNHGFQSAFQTLGINHHKYTPFIKWVGKAYSILVPLGFAIIPIYMYFFM
ncbi:MAG: succinate dehydrogenase cytochrome b subunit [Phaeodactylibacter sp.]|nr:succinate dehydrogenase cytochrome b subunit [Phaeodactylibacter sp.]MCB9302183.1 succinate dehydrogenase cytochrome b subunit [Lewinellaceae bacterium]